MVRSVTVSSVPPAHARARVLPSVPSRPGGCPLPRPLLAAACPRCLRRQLRRLVLQLPPRQHPLHGGGSELLLVAGGLLRVPTAGSRSGSGADGRSREGRPCSSGCHWQPSTVADGTEARPGGGEGSRYYVRDSNSEYVFLSVRHVRLEVC